MSTTIKRVALVAVAALGLGVMSVAPSQAVTNTDSLTLSATTAAQTTAETATATSATATLAFLAGASTDSMSVTASLVSAPSTATALPYLRLVETTSAYVNVTESATALTQRAIYESITPNTAAIVAPIWAGSAVITKAKFQVFLGKGNANTAPTVAGTYVVKLTPAVTAGGGSLNSAAQTITITVSADANLDTVASAANTSSVMNNGDTWTATTDAVASQAKTAGTIGGTIVVLQKNAAGKGLADGSQYVGESLTVTIAGPGTLKAVESATSGTTVGGTPSGARALTLKNGQMIQVFADGSAGTATITIANAAGTVIATESVVFYSTVTAKLTATVKKAYVLAGGAGDSNGGTAATSSITNTRVFIINAFDADGRDMADGAGTITVKPTSSTTDALIGAAGVCSYKAKTSTTVAGYYCSAPGVSSVKFGKVNYTFTATNADATTVTTTADVTFSDSVAKTLTITGPATAGVGEEITLTYTAKDKNGYPVADLSYEGAAGNGALWASVANSNSAFAPFAVGETITTVSGVATKKIYVPATAGVVKTTWTTTGTAGTASGALASTLTGTDIVYSVTVSNPGVDAATDAANEATDAANAATDAALAAADAADAATAAAQDASDAVAALSAQVAKLVSDLKAQIKSLTNLVIKIQKKVKA